MRFSLSQQRYSLAHEAIFRAIPNASRVLIIQDLDGVCMGLVRDPRQRELDPRYIRACRTLAGRFFVLTNGEHTGSCGVNSLVEQSFASKPAAYVTDLGLYLPGLAAGGVQYQNCYGAIVHPGVSQQEMDFLSLVPQLMADFLGELLLAAPYCLPRPAVEQILRTIVLDNAVSPTVNIGALYDYFVDDLSSYQRIQQAVMQLMKQLIVQADRRGLSDSFFIHLAPNLGRKNKNEQLKPASDTDMGTTDFQFMLRGAVKEAGVMVLLNQYYFAQTGVYPLGEGFNVRSAPKDQSALLALAQNAFDPALMPRIIGVGDTVSSSPLAHADGTTRYQRGGSDRGFLSLVQELGSRFHTDNAVLYVDSSRGALKRPGVEPLPRNGDQQVGVAAMQGITDSEDPLRINFVFTGGHRQYTEFFIRLSGVWAGGMDKENG